MSIFFFFQVRKIYEPHLFQNATFLPIFDKYFGPPSQRTQNNGILCVVGFEPNPKHSENLKNLEKTYEKCGWKTTFHTTTAVAHSYGLATFYSDDDIDHNEWGGSIVRSKKAQKPAGITK